MAGREPNNFKWVARDSRPLGYGKRMVMMVTPRREGPRRITEQTRMDAGPKSNYDSINL